MYIDNSFIFIFEYEPSSTDIERWGVKELIIKSERVVFVNAINIFGKKNTSVNERIYDCFRPETKEELIEYIESFDKKTKIIFTSLHNLHLPSLIRKINRLGYETIGLQLGIIPTSKKCRPSTLKDLVKALLKSSITRWLIRSYYNHHIDYLVCSGKKGFEDVSSIYLPRVKKVIKAHSLDYQKHLNSLEISHDSLHIGRYAVFLDQNLTNHIDDKLNGLDFSHLSVPYFDKMNKFFAYLESTLSLEVIILLHPSSNTEELRKAFSNRKVYKGASEHWVKNASLCFCHASTSVAYAVLNDVPVIFLDSKELRFVENSYGNYLQEAFSNELNAKVIPVDKQGDYNETSLFPKIDDEAYRDYIDKYINCSMGHDGSFWDKVIYNLKN